MNVRLNGTTRTFADGIMLSELLMQLCVPEDGVAVAVDRQVVPKSEHAHTRVIEGSDIEVIRAVGGG